jgi:hypothetical protein
MSPDDTYALLGLKRCNRCGAVKSVSEFSPNGSGLHPRCKPCRAKQRRLERASQVPQWVTVGSGPAGEVPPAAVVHDMIVGLVGRTDYEVRILVDGRPFE